MFNKEVSKSLDSDEPGKALRHTEDRMVELLNQLASFTSARLKGFQRMSVEALLTITVHNRDIVNDMIVNKVRRLEDFEWKR